ncbi:MAG TPA: hypothetical protein VFE71_10410 [Bacteroidales bacterium]|jgi:hypothetical protein|nr:hypothetical protein [Bacteroidales bacterium]
MNTLIKPGILMRWLKNKIKAVPTKLLSGYHRPFPAPELFAGKIKRGWNFGNEI